MMREPTHKQPRIIPMNSHHRGDVRGDARDGLVAENDRI